MNYRQNALEPEVPEIEYMFTSGHVFNFAFAPPQSGDGRGLWQLCALSNGSDGRPCILWRRENKRPRERALMPPKPIPPGPVRGIY